MINNSGEDQTSIFLGNINVAVQNNIEPNQTNFIIGQPVPIELVTSIVQLFIQLNDRILFFTKIYQKFNEILLLQFEMFVKR